MESVFSLAYQTIKVIANATANTIVVTLIPVPMPDILRKAAGGQFLRMTSKATEGALLPIQMVKFL